ncbi:hypothetical protein ABFS82_14G150300 [Erythranthe guttata]|uniref:uncharacterized protein LOC105949453 n=1 Tax=Erythranthe guttata TaxID=4155 RepID=UPI00064DCDA1|nr:PREDICTED: uncharacterized protein LOC105949453 [Erythranthe guttata]|eukprot:XP_012828220.1 PREDICTED: uncharacterized protein LOC105949453 [Erythranthe guttata]
MLLLLRRTTTTTAAAAVVVFSRFSSSTTAASNLPKPFSQIPWKHRSKAIQESQKALSEYLHTTRSLPFPYADNIARNSPNSLSRIVSEIPFSPATFENSFQRFLRYHPVNELEFLSESIGLNSEEKNTILPPNTFFLSDWKHFDVVCALAGLGFPWIKLGSLCKELLEIDQWQLRKKIAEIKGFYGFNSVCVISICLVFPRVLYDEMDGLLTDLKTLFLDYDLLSCVEGNVDSLLDVCEKIKTFYDLGCEMGKIGELMGRSKSIFVEYSKEGLISKIDYFCKLNVQKDRIGLFLLSRPEYFGFDLESRVISVSGFLKHFGLNETEVESLETKYPHVFGRNRIANMPHIMRSVNLGEWFFERLKNESPSILDSYAISCTEDLDKHYADNLTKIRAKRTYAHALKKLNFLHNIGFGENKFAMKALFLLNSSSCQLQRRFDCLLRCGIEYSSLCAMVKLSAKILNQQESILEKKIRFLCSDMGSSLQYLDVFPGYLCYDLEKRIRPRFELHRWLMEKGYCEKEYSISTIIASSEKAFVARISRIHEGAAKKWEEGLSERDGELGCGEGAAAP